MGFVKLLRRTYRKVFGNHYKAIGKEHLIKSYVTADGTQYWRFPEKMALPMLRLGKLIEYTQWMSNAKTQQLDEMLDAADEYLTQGLKTGKNASKIGFLHYEIRKLLRMSNHCELLCNIIAVQNIREDESPVIYNEEIHLEKVAAIKVEIEKGNNYFFFQAPESKKLMASLSITENELIALYNESKPIIEALNANLKTILSESKLGKEETMSVN